MPPSDWNLSVVNSICVLRLPYSANKGQRIEEKNSPTSASVTRGKFDKSSNVCWIFLLLIRMRKLKTIKDRKSNIRDRQKKGGFSFLVFVGGPLGHPWCHFILQTDRLWALVKCSSIQLCIWRCAARATWLFSFDPLLMTPPFYSKFLLNFSLFSNPIVHV